MATETVNVNATAINAAITAEAAARVAGDAASVATAASDATAKANAAQAAAIAAAASDATTKANAAQAAAIAAATSADVTLSAAIAGKLTASNNLNDVASVATALTNLGLWHTVMKTSTETRTTTAVLAADSVLKVAMQANTKYAIRLTVFVDSLATPDFKFRLAGPASPTLVRSWMVLYGGPASGGTTASSATSRLENTYSAADITIVSAADQLGTKLSIDMIIHNGASAGDFEFQWAQNTSSGSATSVLAGSYLDWRQIP